MGIFRQTYDAAGTARTFLGRLARDARGNTLAIMAIAIIPLAGMVGGGVDISRMYILKTRMQHACDAGALAGRRAMGGGVWSYNSYYPRTQANQFFDANIESNAFGSSGMTRTFTENAGKVTGNASATLPMTLMRIFGRTTEIISVTCDAEMRLPNTDVMFVLDTTGSMADQQPGDSVSKIEALQVAVKCFYEIVARLDTDATCSTGTPAGGTGEEVQIRFGFVPYSTNVNVGRLLPTQWFKDSQDYQTRTPRWWIRQGLPVEVSAPYSKSSSKNNCKTSNMGGPNSDVTAGTVRTIINTVATSANWAANICSGMATTTTTVYNWREGGSGTANDIFIEWRYSQLPVNVALLKNGTAWNTSLTWPSGNKGADATIRWDGCIEERKTVRATSYDPVPSGAYDLDIDTAPTGDDDTKWAPALDGLDYMRRSGSSSSSYTLNDVVSTSNFSGSSYYCPTESRRLQEWPDASQFDSYVDSLTPVGNTYHDIGLIWGARFLSPTGLYAAQNALTPRGGEIERHLIFMTDGDACTGVTNYTAYGINWYDRRQTDPSAVPTEGCTSNSYTLTEQVNKRTEGLCSAIKNKNITLWVIAFGSLATTTETRLKNCATPGRYFKATNAAALQQTFKTIADQISMLRLTN